MQLIINRPIVKLYFEKKLFQDMCLPDSRPKDELPANTHSVNSPGQKGTFLLANFKLKYYLDVM